MRETPVDGAAEQVTLRSVLAEPLLRSACSILDGPDDAVVDWARPALEVLANESDLHRTVVVGDESMTGLCFFRFEDGVITEIDDFWPEPYEPPAREVPVVDRY